MSQPKASKALLTPAEVAEQCHIKVSALHFYEAKGLISSHRSAGNQRRYQKDVLRRIAIIKIAQQIGMSLTEVGERFAALPASRTPTAADWRALSQHWQSDLDDRIESLLVLRNKLDSCIDCGCLSLKDCPLRASR